MNGDLTLVFGAGVFFEASSLDEVKEYLAICEKFGVKQIDTARGYGKSETVLGQAGASKDFVINTKIPGFVPGTQTSEAVLKAQQTSFKELQVDQVETYFLHAPDPETPIAETLAAMQELYVAGKFKYLGLSNFQPEAVEAVYQHCEKNDFVRPTVFQGQYNPVSRDVETRLFPVLRRLGIRFWAYSAIAGGFLSKTAAYIEASAGNGQGKWNPETILGKLHHKLYNRPKLVDGLRQWNKIAQDSRISGAELAYRYMNYHSLLESKYGDALIIGTGSTAQLKQTLEGLKNGPLPQAIVDEIESVWDIVKTEAPYDTYEVFTEIQKEQNLPKHSADTINK